MSDTRPAVTVVNEAGRSPIVLICEHASNVIPPEFNQLGLPAHELTRHIAWDIGVAELSYKLSAALDAPLFLAGYSRLLIDCNRPVGAPTSIPEVSEVTPIPGNLGLSDPQRQERAERFYWPFQRAVARHLDQRQAAQRPALVIGVHSFTPVFKGFVRPWHAGVLFEPLVLAGPNGRCLGRDLLGALQPVVADLLVVANEPYQIHDASDYTVPVHGRARGLPVCLIEIRQDLLADPAGIEGWAKRLAPALRSVSRPPIR
jgi:predicted N-formylglutamate amidohydrolase